MTKQIKAFPHNYLVRDNESGTVDTQHNGAMDLRDWFAGMALQGYKAHPSNEGVNNLINVAKYCYQLADAMLKARERDNDK